MDIFDEYQEESNSGLNIQVKFRRSGSDFECTSARLRDMSKTVEEDGRALVADMMRQYPDAVEDSFIIVGEVDPGAEPVATLAEAKADALAQLRAKRKAVEVGGFEFNGQTWGSDQKDELRLNSVRNLFDSGVTAFEGWKVSDGVYITLTPELADGAATAMMQHYANAYAVEEGKADEIAALGSVAAVADWLETELDRGW